METDEVDGGTTETSGPDTSTGQVEQTQDSGSVNPAWDAMLQVIPETLRPGVVPYLRKWDENYQKVATDYAPFKEFTKNGVTPDNITEALQVREILLNNPRFLYDRMVQQFGSEWGVDAKPQEETTKPSEDAEGVADFGDDITKHPKFQEVAQQNQVIAQYLLAQENAKQAAAEDAALDQEWRGYAAKYPQLTNPDVERTIFSVAAAQGLSLENAVNWYLSTPMGKMQASNGQTRAPNVMPTSGGVPSTAVDVGKLSDTDTRKLVTEFINASRG